MESKGKRRQRTSQDDQDQDMEMQDTQQPRKIVKVKEQEHKLYDENGEEIEFEGDVESSEEEEEEIVEEKEASDWEDMSSGGEEQAKTKKEIWDEKKEPLKEGEELVFDSSAY